MSSTDLSLPFLIDSVWQQYRIQFVSLRRLHSASGKRIYQAELADGTYRTLRVTDDLSAATLAELAKLLIFFERQNYPAERTILTKERTIIVSVGDWRLFMTTFLVGTPLEYTPTDLALLGAVLGQLHALKPSLTYTPPQADMLPIRELAFAQQQLAAIAHIVPKQFIAQYELLKTAILSIDRCTDLPLTLIHNDCHPGNALLTSPAHATLLDWEGTGMGPAILDIGFLLVNCDGKMPWEPLLSTSFHLEKERLQAVIESYCQYYQLTTDELVRLPDAMRFRSLVFGACNFATSIRQNQNAAFSQYWWTRYCAAEEIADKARRYF